MKFHTQVKCRDEHENWQTELKKIAVGRSLTLGWRLEKESFPGVDVMITIFLQFFSNFRRKNGVFIKNQCYNIFLETSSSMSKKYQYSHQIFWRKYF
jgi:hypothetical protein